MEYLDTGDLKSNKLGTTGQYLVIQTDRGQIIYVGEGVFSEWNSKVEDLQKPYTITSISRLNDGNLSIRQTLIKNGKPQLYDIGQVILPVAKQTRGLLEELIEEK